MKAKAEIVKLKFKVPKDYKDPLKTVTNEDSFDEINVEEWKHYYQIHLGVPQHTESDT